MLPAAYIDCCEEGKAVNDLSVLCAEMRGSSHLSVVSSHVGTWGATAPSAAGEKEEEGGDCDAVTAAVVVAVVGVCVIGGIVSQSISVHPPNNAPSLLLIPGIMCKGRAIASSLIDDPDDGIEEEEEEDEEEENDVNDDSGVDAGDAVDVGVDVTAVLVAVTAAIT